jgi:hypothetical protein
LGLPEGDNDSNAAAVLALALHLQQLLGCSLQKAKAIAEQQVITVGPDDDDGYWAEVD